jgi:aspartyl-tRNA(Asn)/glutamyl-tRNA(Gln) amidotransferase subunit C
MSAAKIDARILADLAKLQLEDDDARRIEEQLQTILRYMESLQGVDVEGVPEYLSAAQPDSSMRADAPADAWSTREALSSAPNARGGLFEVPKFKSE